LASNVSAGIRETTNLFEAGAIVRERLPRYIGKDGTLGVRKRRGMNLHDDQLKD
jgi:vacuolar protein sorting-associated protein 13A/C